MSQPASGVWEQLLGVAQKLSPFKVRAQFGLVASLGGRHHWEAEPSRLLSHYFTYLIFKLYRYLLYNTAI